MQFEENFSESKPPLTKSQAMAEASRCLFCHDAPCIKACPTAINIPQFIGRIASTNFVGAARTILSSNVFGLSCAHSCPTEVLCERACVLNHLNIEPLMIGRLQRFAVEQIYDQNRANKQLAIFETAQPTHKRVALVGSGPASLACAHALHRLGHETVVFEKNQTPGGLNTLGIAPYKMKSHVSLREIEEITSIGIHIEYGCELGQSVDMAGLLKEFDAVFLGLGLGHDKRIPIDGSEHPEVSAKLRGAIEFISELKTKTKAEMQWLKTVRSALVIGGGNTAIDACRLLKKAGIPKVLLSYRRGMAEMPGFRHEITAAQTEGVVTYFHSLPVRYTPSSDGIAVTMKSTSSPNEVMHIDTDLIISAAGQQSLEYLLKDENGNRIEIDPLTLQTTHRRIFAGGDLANGGKEVVNAVADGKKAAQAIHKLLCEEATNG